MNRDIAKRAYEAELKAKPCYHDKTPRKQWHELCDTAKLSWQRNPKPRWEA